MQKYIEIGQSIIKKLADYADKHGLDDEGEYFPLIKISIESIVNTYDSSKKDKVALAKKLTEFVKKIFIETWIKHAIEDEENPNIKIETENAIDEFNQRYGNS